MNVRIPLSSPDITEAEIAAVNAVLRTTQLSMGRELIAFEAALAAYHSVADAVVVSSGTASLHLALITLGVGKGDEVIIPSFAFIALANAVVQVGGVPVFAEIELIGLNLDPESVERAITARTSAIVVVHTFGVPADMEAIRAIATRHGLVVIEDACEAIGAEFDGKRAGGFGDLAVLGFYPNKQITTGEGGAVLTQNPEYAQRLRSLRNQGRVAQRQAIAGGAERGLPDWLDQGEAGFNYRLSEMECALGRVQLGRIDEILGMRRAAAQRYHALLEGIPGLELPPLELARRSISWFVFVVRTTEEADRDELHDQLATRGIAAGRYFGPIHEQPAWRSQPGTNAELPLTESIARRTLALPFFNQITAGQQEEVASVLRKLMKRSYVIDSGSK